MGRQASHREAGGRQYNYVRTVRKFGPSEKRMTADSAAGAITPRHLTTFVGRRQELAQIQERLKESRLLMLAGPGGCGKTRLAVELANRIADQFPDGAWTVELASVAEPSLVPYAVAAALGVQEQPGQPLTSLVTKYLRSKDALLVLDNCEHLLEPAAELSENILRSCPLVRILATSREPMNLEGEVTWRVPGMSLPDLRMAKRDQRIKDSDAVVLFVDRARLADPGFSLSGTNAPIVAQICLRLDGIPLAIELAATRVKVLRVEQILERLEQIFRLLTGGARTVMPRHRTLRAAFDWSYELLTEPERAIFRRMSVFAGSFSLEAVEMVCSDGGDEPVLDVVSHLLDKSMLGADHSSSSATRYRLLETLRQYGSERLEEAGETATVRRRHADHFLDFAQRLASDLRTPSQNEAIAGLDLEHDNLRAALAWSREEDPRLGLRLGIALTNFWQMRGFWTEGRAWLRESLAKPVEDRGLLAGGLLGAGTLAEWQGDYSEAGMMLEQALEIFRELGDARSVSACMIELGRAAYFQGQPDVAGTFFETGLAAAREAQDQWAIARSLTELGQVAWRRAEYVQSRELVNEGLAMFRGMGDQYDLVYAVDLLGHADQGMGDLASARKHFEESLGRAREVNDLWGVAHSHSNLGDVALDQGELNTAQSEYVAAADLHHVLGRPAGLLTYLEGFACLAAARKEFERAVVLESLCEKLRESFGVGWRRDMRTRVDRLLPGARERLGSAAAAKAEARGRAMNAEDGHSYCKEAYGYAVDSRHAPSSKGPRLTRREEDVAALVARGLTSRQIAARLFISERTAETHVDRIMTKLDFHSRTQIAVWAVQKGLVDGADGAADT